ncbi:MAG: amino acid adenylation domain-containing protein [Cyanosarcina radialis HA8281-LM2]|nr:amino acid adenylation domain-containing protein [Cyanosarcina radialis HA8281-LM2]
MDISTLSVTEKRALLADLLQKKASYFPLSFAQQRLWFLDRLNPNKFNYNLAFGVRLTGLLDIKSLEQTLNEVVRRHETLRTSFKIVEGRSVQVIEPALTLSLPVVNLQELSEVDRANEIQRLIEKESQHIFNLTQAPLLKTTLLRSSETEHILLLTMHHIISDAWSIALLIQEVATIYAAFSSGKPSPLPELTIQYADFAVWQHQLLQDGKLESQLAYWQQQLDSDPPVLQLPTDRPRPAVQTFRGTTQSFSLSPELSRAIASLSRQAEVTLFMTLLAAFKTLLYRYTSQEDILVGSPIANRHRADTNELIGFFVNTLVLRTDLSGNPSFWELLKRVKECTLSAYAHQDLPFEYLVEKLQPDRDLSHNPLFQVSFGLQNVPTDKLELPGLAIDYLKLESQTANFDLSLDIYETESEIAGAFEYNTDLFEAATIDRMIEHFCNLLSAIVANPHQQIAQLSLLSSSERHQLLEKGNFRESYKSELCIHQLFERQVEKTPEAIALIFENQHLTYRELNERANRLAHHLQQLGVESDVLVGLCVDRSLDMVVGILAILKAGGAYVPLDPTYPQERLAFMLADSQVPVLLTQSHLIPTLPEHNAQVVCLDTDWESSPHPALSGTPLPSLGEGKGVRASKVNSQNLAYVIYTSGSTGKPKGVLIPHANVVRLLEATQSWFQFDRHDAWTLFHSYAFDFSVWEIWGALLYGGRLVIVPYWVSRSPAAFYDLLCQQQVTVLNQTPSAFRQLIHLESSDKLNLRLVIFGGEALEIQSLKPWFEKHGDEFPRLVNMYGITETTVHVTYRPLTIADLDRTGSAIGCPIPDLSVYVLDRYLQPVPIGVPGEMYVGGAGLARGYLNRPELDAERFISSPFKSERLYKTGDLARYLPNGDLEYLGRIDSQVKIRGFRIELGEIEAVLSQHPAIAQSTILLRDDRLVAYVVSKFDRPPTTTELRSFLKQQLPDYIVPSAFVFLPSLPLTSNGKIDRQALPAPDTNRPELAEAFVAPSTAAEQILAEIWSRVLGIDRIGVDDNFFALGGDSIRSIQVRFHSQAKGLHFSLQQLFQHQTIRTLAQNLAAGEVEAQPVEPFALICPEDRAMLPADVEDAYPLTALQMGMLFHSEYNPDSAVYHNVSSVHLQAPFDWEKLQIAIRDLVDRHPILRTSFDLTKYREPLQLVRKKVDIPLPVEDLRHLSVAEQDNILGLWFEAEKKHPFAYQNAPLLRFQIHRRSEETFQFSFTEHHAILDGWSLASAISELFEHYLFLLGKEVPPIAPLPVSHFRDFVALQKQAWQSVECQEYWQQKLHSCQMTTLPRWGVKSGVATVYSVEVAIDPEVSQSLKQLADTLGVPLRSVLLAAHLQVLSVVSSRSDVLTGLSSNGRPETADGERCLGLFLNTLPFRLQLSAGNWTDLVRQTFEGERELLPFRRYPTIQIQQDLGGKHLFETSFNFTNFHVYQRLQKSGDIEVLNWRSFAITDLVLLANFSFDPIASQIYLDLEWNAYELCAEQAQDLGNYYAKVLELMATNPQGYWGKSEAIAMQEQTQKLLEMKKQEVKDKHLSRLKAIERKVVRG